MPCSIKRGAWHREGRVKRGFVVVYIGCVLFVFFASHAKTVYFKDNKDKQYSAFLEWFCSYCVTNLFEVLS